MGCTKPAFVCNYLKKKPLSIFFDVVFVVIIILLINPGTRKDVAAFFIRLTSLPPSTLESDEQFTLSRQTDQWKVYRFDGQPVSLNELHRKPLFLNVWATWCPPCVAELPAILELYGEMKNKANFVLISNENPAMVKAFLEKNKYPSAPFYFYRNLPFELQTQSIPTTYIIDKNGKVVVAKKGAARWNTGKIRKLISRLAEH